MKKMMDIGDEADECEVEVFSQISQVLGVRLILRSKPGKMTVDEKRPEMLPAIGQDERSKCKNRLTAINGPFQ